MGEEASWLDIGDNYIDSFSFYRDSRKPHKGGLYQCTMCKQYKPKREFYVDKRVPCGIRSKCKECYHK